MSQWRAIQCPNCKDAIGVLLPDMSIRCEHKVKEWLAHESGYDKKAQKPIVEFECVTAPGCGGIIALCRQHGCRSCLTCPSQFAAADIWPLAPYVPYSVQLRRDIEASNHRRETERAAAKAAATALEFTSKQAPAPSAGGRVQMPFLGEAEPTQYKPARRQREKRESKT